MEQHWATFTHRVVVGAVGLLLTIVCYVLSYAPAYRIFRGPDPTLVTIDDCINWWDTRNDTPERWEAIYLPVMLLIDHTPLQDPLLAWGKLNDVELSLMEDAFVRLVEREFVSRNSQDSESK